MRRTPVPIEATPLGGYAVRVRFEDGTAADVGLGYLVDYGGVFAPLRDPAYFQRLRADPEAATIVWPNDADIAPEMLYGQARRPPRLPRSTKRSTRRFGAAAPAHRTSDAAATASWLGRRLCGSAVFGSRSP